MLVSWIGELLGHFAKPSLRLQPHHNRFSRAACRTLVGIACRGSAAPVCPCLRVCRIRHGRIERRFLHSVYDRHRESWAVPWLPPIYIGRWAAGHKFGACHWASPALRSSSAMYLFIAALASRCVPCALRITPPLLSHTWNMSHFDTSL